MGRMQARLQRWLESRHPRARGPIELNYRQIYILPTTSGYAFGAMLMVMLLWSINYSNSMGFAMTFLMASIAVGSMHRVHDNLLRLRIQPGSAQPVFAGQRACFRFPLCARDGRARHEIALQGRTDPLPQSSVDIPNDEEVLIEAALPTTQRGWVRPERLVLSTAFPLGLFRAWSHISFERPVLVYPQPVGTRPLPANEHSHALQGSQHTEGGSEDFSGLRTFRDGDSPRHVAWKASTRSRELAVKQFSSPARPELWLEATQLADLDLERQLSQLCVWVLNAEREGLRYGLRLGGFHLPPSHGERHQRQCLEALALYQLDEDREPKL